MSTTTAIPLRERKRLETWATLHESAASLALAHDGLNGVTVDEIVERANVCARTFFNYFDSKEDAILGFSEPRIDDKSLAAFSASTEPMTNRVADFYFDVVQNSRTSGMGRQRRVEIIRRHPELANRQMTHFAQVEKLVRDVVVEHLPSQALPTKDLTVEEFAEALVVASTSAHRIAVRRSTSTSTDEDDRAAMHRALSQLREATQHIQ